MYALLLYEAFHGIVLTFHTPPFFSAGVADLEASGVHEKAGVLPRQVHGQGRGPGGAGWGHPPGVGEGSRGTRPVAQEVPQERSVY